MIDIRLFIAIGLGFVQTFAIFLGGILVNRIKDFTPKKEVSILSFSGAVMIGIAFLDMTYQADKIVPDAKYIVASGFIFGLVSMIVGCYLFDPESTRGSVDKMSLRLLFKNPKLFEKGVKCVANKNIISEIQSLPPPLKQLYFEICKRGRASSSELIEFLNFDNITYYNNINNLIEHNYIKKLNEKGKEFYQINDESKIYEEKRKIGWKTVLGFSIHDFPEGLTLGAVFATVPSAGILVAISLFIHNIPEGISIATGFKGSGYSILKTHSIPAFLNPIGALIGFLLAVQIPDIYMAFILAASAGFFVYIALLDLFPDAYELNEKVAMTGAMLFGFCIAFLIFMM